MKALLLPACPGSIILRAVLIGVLLIICGVGLVHPASAQDGPDPGEMAEPPGEEAPGSVPLEEESIDLLPIPIVLSNTLRFPANALNFDKTSTIITQVSTGLRWQSNYLNAAFLVIPKPANWNGAGTVSLSLYFYPTTSASGNVDFFIRPRAYDSGDIWGDAGSMDGAAVATTGVNRLHKQVFSIPAASFGSKSMWVISLQREGSEETYTDDIILSSVRLSYSYQSTTTGQVALPANAINFDKNSSVITQAGAGIRWQSNYINAAYLSVPRPADWDGISDVTLHLYFYTTTSSSGNVAFFIRPRAYNSGDSFGDADSLNGAPVPVSAIYQVREQTFTIPAEEFGDEGLWVMTLQREGAGETYADDVILTSTMLSYTRRSVNFSTTVFPANALNFNKNSTILTQAASGIRWQANYADSAFLILPRPTVWDGATAVTLHLYFLTTSSTNGLVDFFIRPRAFDVGDLFVDAVSLNGDGVQASKNAQVLEQVFTIPSATFGDRELWIISMQRQATGETYTDDVILVGASIDIPFNKLFLPLTLR